MAVEKKGVMVKLKLRNKKHSSKQFLPTIHTLEKKFFAAATFDGL